MKKKWTEAERRAYRNGKIRGWYAAKKNMQKKAKSKAKPGYGAFDTQEALVRNFVRQGFTEAEAKRMANSGN